MIIKVQKKINFRNACNCFAEYEELEKAIVWYAQKPVTSFKKIYMHGNYPAISIGRDKIHIHRLLMNYWLGTKIPNNFFVHHINGNKLDARKENLAVVYNVTHQREHNKGKIISEEHKERIRINNHKRKGKPRKKKYEISKEDLDKIRANKVSINKIAKKYNCEWSVVKSRL